MFGIGAGEFILILIVGLIVFGPSKLPGFGRSLGKMLKEFRKAQAQLSASINLDEDEKNSSVKNNSSPQSSTIVKENSTPQKSVDDLTNMINANPIKLDKEVKP